MLEQILKTYFNDKDELFNNNGYITEAGMEAYSTLTQLLYDVGKLIERDMNNIIDDLDFMI